MPHVWRVLFDAMKIEPVISPSSFRVKLTGRKPGYHELNTFRLSWLIYYFVEKVIPDQIEPQMVLLLVHHLL